MYLYYYKYIFVAKYKYILYYYKYMLIFIYINISILTDILSFPCLEFTLLTNYFLYLKKVQGLGEIRTQP